MLILLQSSSPNSNGLVLVRFVLPSKAWWLPPDMRQECMMKKTASFCPGAKWEFGACPLRSSTVWEDTLRTRSARINLTCLHLRDHLGQSQTPGKGCWCQGAFWDRDGRCWWGCVTTWGPRIVGKWEQSDLLNELHWIFWCFWICHFQMLPVSPLPLSAQQPHWKKCSVVVFWSRMKFVDVVHLNLSSLLVVTEGTPPIASFSSSQVNANQKMIFD